MNTNITNSHDESIGSPARQAKVHGWQRWVPYAAVAWSLVYAGLGVYWAVSGRGFPYTSELAYGVTGSLAGRFGLIVSWIIVILVGIPAVVLGESMQHRIGGKSFRPLFIVMGSLVTGILILFMTDINLLILLGYIPYTVYGIITGDKIGQIYLASLTQWATVHQVLCLVGGFLWLGATVSYARRSAGACVYCGRGNDAKGWQQPDRALRWGRIAVYTSLAVPIIYAIIRIVWVVGIPLGMTDEAWQKGQEAGLWISGLFLALFGLVGAALTLGLVQRWGEIFPRWMPGLAGRRVPVGLAVIPATLAAVLLIVGGISMWSGVGQVAANLAVAGVARNEIMREIIFQIGPTLLFPVWGVSLAVATLGYYFRRRGVCKVCGRGASIYEPVNTNS